MCQPKETPNIVSVDRAGLLLLNAGLMCIRQRLHPNMYAHPLSNNIDIKYDLPREDEITSKDIKMLEDVMIDRWQQLNRLMERRKLQSKQVTARREKRSHANTLITKAKNRRCRICKLPNILRRYIKPVSLNRINLNAISDLTCKEIL